MKCRALYMKVFVVPSGILTGLLVLTGKAKRGCEKAESVATMSRLDVPYSMATSSEMFCSNGGAFASGWAIRRAAGGIAETYREATTAVHKTQ
jgi:hypothetical protein